MKLLINIPDEYDESFYNDRFRHILEETVYNLYKCEGINFRCIQFVKDLIFSFNTAVPVDVTYTTEKTKNGFLTQEIVKWNAEAERRLNKESTITKLYDLKEQNEKLKKLLSKMIYVLSDPATTNLDKITSCFGYNLDELLGEDWRQATYAAQGEKNENRSYTKAQFKFCNGSSQRFKDL